MNNKSKNTKNPGNKSKEYIFEFRNEEVISRLIDPYFEMQADPLNSRKKIHKRKIVKKNNSKK